jgi:urease accessory protein
MSDVSGRISAGFSERDGQTVLGDRYHTYPLKIAKTFSFDYGQLGVYMMDASPGIMAGDRYEMNWQFGERANVYITNQSYTKVHPARLEGGEASAVRPSEQLQTLKLGKNSYVEYMPEPLMLYKDAVLQCSTDVQMESGSTLIISDLICPGRTHRGEIFQYECYQNQLTVTYEDELIYCSKQRIKPAEQTLQTIGGWADCTHIGTLYVFGEQAAAAFADSLREHLDIEQDAERVLAAEITEKPLYYGVSLTYTKGLVISIMGNKVYEIQSLQDTAWRFIRQRLFSRNPLLVRK